MDKEKLKKAVDLHYEYTNLEAHKERVQDVMNDPNYGLLIGDKKLTEMIQLYPELYDKEIFLKEYLKIIDKKIGDLKQEFKDL